MENLDDQTRKLLQEDRTYTEGQDEIRQLSDAIWSGITSKLDQQSPPDQPFADHTTPPHRLRQWLIAASVIGLLLIGGAVWLKAPKPTASLPQPEEKVANL